MKWSGKAMRQSLTWRSGRGLRDLRTYLSTTDPRCVWEMVDPTGQLYLGLPVFS
jgi:hypothetical protein